MRSAWQLLAQNSAVYKNGKSTGITSGTVTSSSAIASFNSSYFSDMVLTDYNSVDGDSGGVVYGAPNAYDYAYVAGIHMGGVTSGKIYSKASNALNALGAGMY